MEQVGAMVGVADGEALGISDIVLEGESVGKILGVIDGATDGAVHDGIIKLSKRSLKV